MNIVLIHPQVNEKEIHVFSVHGVKINVNRKTWR